MCQLCAQSEIRGQGRPGYVVLLALPGQHDPDATWLLQCVRVLRQLCALGAIISMEQSLKLCE